MRILITGALGHIGSKVIHSIRPGQFEEVRLIDDLSAQRYVSLFDLPRGINFKFFQEDILMANLNYHLRDIDVVIHLAAVTDASSSFEKSDQVERTNFHGTQRVADACMSNNCKLLFPSTTSVYGTQEEIVDELCPIEDLKPQSPYAESKLKAEQFLLQLGQANKLQFTICRFGTIFGTSIGMRFHTAVNKFIWQASLGVPITVWRTAMNQKRPYLDLSDAVKAIFFIVENNIFTNDIYNVLTVNSSVGEIVNKIKESIPDTKVEFVDSKIMNQLSYCVSSEKFKKAGFEFSGDLSRGITETIRILKGIHQ